MTEAICVLERKPATAERRRPRRLASRKAIVEALSTSRGRQVWVLPTQRTVSDLVGAMAAAAPGVRAARLVSYFRPAPGTAQVLDSGFDRTLLGAPAMVPMEDLEEILGTDRPEDYCIGAEWDRERDVLALWLGDLSAVLVPMKLLTPRGGVAPDPERISVEDCGQTIRLGNYEASVDALLYERDPEYRRRAKKRILQEEEGLGASIRRLRLQKGVARHEFDGLDERTLARIERGEVKRPHRRTLATIAKRLGVAVEELDSF